jgi:thiol-disulfide isomerase/thioredoxin
MKRIEERPMNLTHFHQTVFSLLFLIGTVAAEVPTVEIDPFWISLHEPTVIDELKLSSEQVNRYEALMDRLDPQFMPLRNQPPKDHQKAMTRLVDEARKGLTEILTSAQQQRLQQIQLWRLGTASLLHADVVKRMKYSDSQRKKLEDLVNETKSSVADIAKRANSGEPREPLEKRFKELKTDEQLKAIKLLKSDQKAAWLDALGPAFDLTKPSQLRYRAPEFAESSDWLNSPPLRLAEQRGKVVIVHFYASNCINCIHNYPSYREWQERYKDKDVVIIGIHTPETSTERDLSHVRKKAVEEKLSFPILIDGESNNWNAWGNSIWPSVYLIDKRGYLRNFWVGELNWQGASGDQFVRDRIETMLAEPAH